MERRRLRVTGRVQGVGFRPAVWREARALGLVGWVRNTGVGAEIEAQGEGEALNTLERRLRALPAPIEVHEIAVEILEIEPAPPSFAVAPSVQEGAVGAGLPLDVAPCTDCLDELNTDVTRRYRYAFVTCARCGPRYTLLEGAPFDRARTAMRHFPLCPACEAEYHDPADRRFHAETLACPTCGPHLLLTLAPGVASWPAAAPLRACAMGPRDGDRLSLRVAGGLLEQGAVLALKGVGGFQLLCEARDEAAVRRLRERKRRPERPLAVMFRDLEQLQAAALPTSDETSALQAFDRPIVLVRLRPEHGLAPSVTGGLPRVGAMLPSSPLHHLLMAEATGPLVCTSGNPSGEPLALEWSEGLAALAEAVLHHNRPVLRAADDGVLRVTGGGVPVLLRLGRGRAPRVLALPGDGPAVLALGAHNKASVTLCWGGSAVVGPYGGDLSSAEARRRHGELAEDLCRMHSVRPSIIACDLHPDYGSSALAEALAARWGARLVRVQHHHAHAAAVLAEHGYGAGRALCWDGVGLGSDGGIWGGELLEVSGPGFRRLGALRPFPAAAEGRGRAPAVTAAGLKQMLQAEYGELGPVPEGCVGPQDIRAAAALARLGRSTGAMGRLFDGFACWAGVRQEVSYEAQAALEWEALAEAALGEEEGSWRMPVREGELRSIDWGPTLRALWEDAAAGASPGVLGARFHRTLAALAVTLADGASELALAGGCFQNAVLLDLCVSALQEAGVRPLFARELPANDQAISLGQAVVARAGG